MGRRSSRPAVGGSGFFLMSLAVFFAAFLASDHDTARTARLVAGVPAFGDAEKAWRGYKLAVLAYRNGDQVKRGWMSDDSRIVTGTCEFLPDHIEPVRDGLSIVRHNYGGDTGPMCGDGTVLLDDPKAVNMAPLIVELARDAYVPMSDYRGMSLERLQDVIGVRLPDVESIKVSPHADGRMVRFDLKTDICPYSLPEGVEVKSCGDGMAQIVMSQI